MIKQAKVGVDRMAVLASGSPGYVGKGSPSPGTITISLRSRYDSLVVVGHGSL